MAKIYLIGAGPGDPGLLTLRAREILSRAEIVVYDYLANEAFLDYCPANTEFIYVGKKGGEHTLGQQEINQLLIEKAGSGKLVVRLKGGDPFIFGRGGEEAEELVEAGLEYEVVPGISAAVAVPAYAGIPLTHREYSSSVTLITGHEDAHKQESSHNWTALAESGSTLVFFMGVKNLSGICANLKNAGMSKETPVALIRWGTTCEQASLCGTLQTINDQAKAVSFKPPALLVVGEVVKLKDKLEWFEKKPLLGQGVIITRAREQASELAAILAEKGACCLQAPTIKIEPLEDYSEARSTVAEVEQFKWVVFTSVNGVKYFWQILKQLQLDSRALGGCRIGAIGPATADILRSKGIEPDFIPDSYVAESVAKGLILKGINASKILIPRAEKAREVLPQTLEQAGAEVTVLPVYRTVLARESKEQIMRALQEERVRYITFTSSSTVDNFFSLVPPDVLSDLISKVKLACIGPITAETLSSYGYQAHIVPQEYTIPALAQALEDNWNKR